MISLPLPSTELPCEQRGHRMEIVTIPEEEGREEEQNEELRENDKGFLSEKRTDRYRI